MKTLIFYLCALIIPLIIIVGCRDIFGERTGPESIVNPPEESIKLEVTEPIHGRIWNPGDTILIKWIAPSIKKIDLELYRKNEYKFNIASEITNNGFYFWIIPSNIPLSNHYLIKVSNHSNPDVFNFSGRFGVQ